MDIEEYVRVLLEACAFLSKRWGTHLEYAGLAIILRNGIYYVSDNGFVVAFPPNAVYQRADLEHAQRVVETMALWFASKDWLSKVAGSMKRLKGVIRALKE